MGFPLLIDTDPGIDDALALLLAGASPELEVLAVTVTAGNVGADRTTENARRVLPIAWGERPWPSLHGPSRPEAPARGAEAIHGADGLGGAAGLYPPAAPLAPGDAADAILAAAAARPGDVTLVTLGPLTNLAEALRRDPAGARRLRRVVVMGGAFRQPGNVTPVAEYNIWADPEAAQSLCDSGLPITWVPLDVTTRCLLTPQQLERLPATPRVEMARRILPVYLRYYMERRDLPGCCLHDPLAVGALLWPELLRTRSLRVDVERRGELTRGMTVADFRRDRIPRPAPNAEVCLEVDAEAFVARFLERLAR